MNTEALSKEERILRAVKKVLTDVAKDTFTRPGVAHPLSDQTIQGIRECFGLIAARERELAEAADRPMSQRPHFTDEKDATAGSNVVVPLGKLGGRKKPRDSDGQT
ncbi:MAG: segregation and condensation protein A [Acidiferrobacterales bacterium]